MTTCKYKDIDYNLHRRNRKTISIYVERDSNVTVAAPEHIEEDDLNKIIESKRYWIYKAQLELQELNKTSIQREIVDGEGFLFLGRSFKLRIDDNLIPPLDLSGDYFLLDKKVTDNAKKHFIDFYKNNGMSILQDRVGNFSAKLGLNPEGIRVMELKNRWASKSESGVLNFHWKLIMAPLSAIDYVIVHELAHMIEENHNNAFWSIVESVIPDYLERKNWLKVNGASLSI